MNRLQQLAAKHGTDKHGHHDYCRHYHEHFAQFQEAPITVLELGIGGYQFKDRGGEGLRMWSEYFKRGKIYGIDIHDKTGISLPPRTHIFKGGQDDGNFLLGVMSSINAPDIIIDDASHMNKLTINSFKHLFPWLKPGGYYVIEDIHSSWWNEHGFDGCTDSMNLNAFTTINFCRWLINDLNEKNCPPPPFPIPARQPYEIDAIHFYEKLVIIKKK